MQHLLTDYIHGLQLDARRMDVGEYHGFAIGAGSMHPELEVTCGKSTYVVRIGSPLILPVPFTGRPSVAPIRRLLLQASQPHADENTRPISFAHLIGYECEQELLTPVAQELRAYSYSFNFDNGDGSGADRGVLVVPCAGRKKIVFGLRNNDRAKVLAHTYVMGGGTPRFDNGSSPITMPTSETADLDWDGNVSTSELISTTESELIVCEDCEAFDMLELQLGDGSTFSTDVDVRLY